MPGSQTVKSPGGFAHSQSLGVGKLEQMATTPLEQVTVRRPMKGMLSIATVFPFPSVQVMVSDSHICPKWCASW